MINKNNVGAIYKHINSRLTHKSGIAPLKNSQNDLIVDSKEKAELLNTHFVSVGTVDDGVLPNISFTSDASFDSISFTTSRVLKVISKLKKNSAAGPDGFAPIIFMSLKASLAYPLSLLFTAIFQNGVLPDEWKKAIVTPMFKKGKSSDPNNYRPISLTCVCCKLFESVIKDQLLSYLTLYSLITDTQHGFLQKHSTITNLAESLNNWTMSLEKKIPVKVLYIDFEKAFDKVSVPKLLHKLEHLGISGLLLQCIRSFLTQRTQAVRIDGVQSRFLRVISGVPQGSVLGPFLFLLFINDLPDIFDPSFRDKLFADDLKLYKSIDNSDDNLGFQLALNQLSDWCNRWQLKLSVAKCGSLFLRGSTTPNDNQDLFIDGNSLTLFESTKDLGVTIDSRLSFTAHIDEAVSKAKSRCYLLLKSFRNRNIRLMVFAFKVYVLPLLDYCSTIWCPYKLNDIDRIEAVQRSFTKKLEGLATLSYVERLLVCELPSLELRRLRTDLILCFKIIHKLIALNFSDFFQFDTNSHGTRGHRYKLMLPLVRTSVRKNFFAVRIIPAWNFLPDEIVSLCDVAIFKTKLLCIELSSFLVRI